MQKNINPEKSAKAYAEYLQEMEAQNVADRDEQGKAHIYLANYDYLRKDYETAYKHAFKCLEFPEVIYFSSVILILRCWFTQTHYSSALGQRRGEISSR